MAPSTTDARRSPRCRSALTGHAYGRTVIGLALIAALAGCRAPAADRPAPPLRRATLVHITPATFATRARTTDDALILGTHGTRHATRLPLAPTPSAVLVDIPAATAARPLLVAAWPVQDPAGAGPPIPGAMADSAPLTGPDPDQAPAAWLALRAAAHALGKDTTALRLAAVPGTDADAALRDPLSAPAIAAGLLASLTGAPALPEAVVPPALLLPDHTVLELPAAATREPHDRQRTEDSAAGVPTRQPWNLRAAFSRRTGVRLRGPWPVRARVMRLSPALGEHLAARYLAHRSALLPHWTVLLRLAPGERAPAALHALLRSAQDMVASAERARAQGQILTAHEQLALAEPEVTAASVLWQVMTHLRAAEPTVAHDLVAALAADADAAIAAAGAQIQDARPTTLAGHLGVAAAVQDWLVAASLRSVASALLAEQAAGAAAEATPDPAPTAERRQLERAERRAEALAPAVLALARARASAMRAEGALRVPAPAGAIPYQCAPAALNALAAQDLAVSQSSMALESTAPADTTERLLRARLQAALDHGPRWARGGAAPTPALGFATPCTRAVAALAAAQLARMAHGRALLSRHAADAHLGTLLARSDRAAREHARAALAATGAVPATARLAFQSAREHVRRDDPAGALVRFWAASLHAELAVTLARHAR